MRSSVARLARNGRATTTAAGGHGDRGGGFGGPSGSRPGGPGSFGRGGRARRGDVRAALLTLLAEEPRNGYRLMQEIEHRSDGVWRPSPGSVYPALQQLEDEGLVRSEETEGRKLFQLTDAGREAAEARVRRGRAVGRRQRVGRLRRLGAVRRRPAGRDGDLPDRPGRHRRAARGRPRDPHQHPPRAVRHARRGRKPSGEDGLAPPSPQDDEAALLQHPDRPPSPARHPRGGAGGSRSAGSPPDAAAAMPRPRTSGRASSPSRTSSRAKLRTLPATAPSSSRRISGRSARMRAQCASNASRSRGGGRPSPPRPGRTGARRRPGGRARPAAADRRGSTSSATRPVVGPGIACRELADPDAGVGEHVVDGHRRRSRRPSARSRAGRRRPRRRRRVARVQHRRNSAWSSVALKSPASTRSGPSGVAAGSPRRSSPPVGRAAGSAAGMHRDDLDVRRARRSQRPRDRVPARRSAARVERSARERPMRRRLSGASSTRAGSSSPARPRSSLGPPG